MLLTSKVFLLLLFLVGGIQVVKGINSLNKIKNNFKLKRKKKKMKNKQLTTFKSLTATINFHRPDLLDNKHESLIIPLNPPEDFFSGK